MHLLELASKKKAIIISWLLNYITAFIQQYSTKSIDYFYLSAYFCWLIFTYNKLNLIIVKN